MIQISIASLSFNFFFDNRYKVFFVLRKNSMIMFHVYTYTYTHIISMKHVFSL